MEKLKRHSVDFQEPSPVRQGVMDTYTAQLPSFEELADKVDEIVAWIQNHNQ